MIKLDIGVYIEIFNTVANVNRFMGNKVFCYVLNAGNWEEKYGLSIAWRECLVVSKKNAHGVNYKPGDFIIKTVRKYKHLWSDLKMDAKCYAKIQARIVITNDGHQKLNKFLKAGIFRSK